MICSALLSLTSSDARGVRGVFVNGFDQRALYHGASVTELPLCRELSPFELDAMHTGKDASINHMLNGGNGYPAHPYNPIAAVGFDCGCTIERRDIRALLVWSRDLNQCMRDKAGGLKS